MARIFKTLADASRLRLLATMTLDCKSVSELAAAARLSQPLASHHLRILREGGLARADRRGSYIFY